MSPSMAVLAPEDTSPRAHAQTSLVRGHRMGGGSVPTAGELAEGGGAEVDGRGGPELNETHVQRNDLFGVSVPAADFSATLLGCAQVASAPQHLSTLPRPGGALTALLILSEAWGPGALGLLPIPPSQAIWS